VPLFVGIDGGGTKTACAVGDEMRVIAIAEAGGSNLIRSGEAHARVSLLDAIDKACAEAGITPAGVCGACIGAAGAGRSEVKGAIARIAAKRFRCQVHVVGDTEIAMQAAFAAGPGVIVIAGTGSIAFGRDAEGNTTRAGGWGFAISDEGSGHWVGRVAVRRALAACDEGQDPTLLKALMKDLPATSLEEFIRACNLASDFSRLFPAVLAAADTDDGIARGVLTQAGAELAHLAKTVLKRLFPPQADSVPLAMVGGVFRQSALVRQVFYNEVRSAFPGVVINPTVIEPVLGALALARQQVRASGQAGPS
jgi:N-acetylglucosamine kinase-like BadF-type ATPase